MRKRLLASFLIVSMLMSLLPTVVLAEEDVLSSPDAYTDVTLSDAIAYLSGSGTKDDPFQIWNGDDLYYINYIEYWNGTQPEGDRQVYYYQQMTDLDLSAASQFDKGTGYITANFGGVYNGGGYSITGMDRPLFYFTKGSYIGDSAGTVFTDYVSGVSYDKVFTAIVENLVIEAPHITQTVATDVIEQMGAVAAYAVNTAFYNVRVLGGEVNGVSGSAAIAGRAGSVVIDSCSSNSSIYASAHRAAGIVSNLRIVDTKKGAETTSLVTNCTFSGSISGNLDGERGSAGIVGAVYMDGTSVLNNGDGLPLYLTDCTFSGTLSGTVTSGSGNFGGILGTSYLGPGLYLRGNKVTGTISNVTVAAGATAANVGGVVGKMLNYSLLSSNLVLTMEGNDTSAASLPGTDPDNLLYVGTVVGCQSDPNRTITGSISISNSQGLGDYGTIQGAQLAGDVGDLVLPATSGSTQLYILAGATVNSVTADASSGLNIYNYGTLGTVTNTAGVNIYANTGLVGEVVSQTGAVNVGGGNKNADTAGDQIGNQGGSIQSITAAGNVSVYRNTGAIGDVESLTGSVAIGQNSASYGEYNTNSGTIGSVSAETSVAIYGLGSAGKVAAEADETVTAGTSVTIGTNTVLNGAAMLNQNQVGAVQAGTTVTVYNGGNGSVGAIEAGGNVTVYANAAGGSMGSITSTAGSITVGADSKSESNNGSGAYVGNEGALGDLTAYGAVAVKRNAGTVGNLTSTTSSVAVGQDNANYVEYNTNSGTVGSIDAGTSVAIYGTSDAGRVAAEAGQLIQAGTTVTIGKAAYFNQNTLGPVQAGTTVTLYSQTDMGTINAGGNVAVGAATAPNTGDVGNITSTAGSVTIYAAQGVTAGAVEAGTSVTIGSAACPSQGTVASVTAGRTVAIVNGAYGSVGVVDAGSTVTIGAAAALNLGPVGAVETAGGANIYNGSVQLSTIHGGGAINIYANEGTIGDVTSDTNTVTVGAKDKTAANANGQEGNSGSIGDIQGVSINVYRNVGQGQISSLTTTTGAIVIGQSDTTNDDVAQYNGNSGTIGSVSAGTSVAIRSVAAGNVATGTGQAVRAGTSVTIGSTQNPNGNDVGPTVSGTTATLYSGAGKVASLTAGTTNKAYITDSSSDVNLVSSNGDITVVDQTTSAQPSVNVITDGGDVHVERDEGDLNPILAKVNLTVTDDLAEGQTLFIRGTFASVVHNGAGDVLMESADTSVTNVVQRGTGQVKTFGSTGTVIQPGDDASGINYLLSLVPVDVSTLDVYLLTTDGSALNPGTLSLSVQNGAYVSSNSDTLIGGGISEKVGTVTVDTSAAQTITVTVSGTYTPNGGAAVSLEEADYQMVIPAAVDRVDTVLLTSEDEFNAAKTQYGWNTTSAPQNYPVLAVMPVVNEAYAGVTAQVEGATVNTDGVYLMAVNAETALQTGVLTAEVEVTGNNVPSYVQSISYTLTAADKAKLDSSGTDYYYVTLRYMDGQTADEVVPVVKGQSMELPEANQRPDYTFLGWQDNQNLYVAGATFTPAADTTLIAQWGANAALYTLNINIIGGGSVVQVINGTEYPISSGTRFLEGETVVLRAKRSSGYSFHSWTVNGIQSYNETVTVTMDGNQTVTAAFYAVSSSSDSSSGSTSTYRVSSGSVEHGTITVSYTRASQGTQVTITASPDYGYELGSIQVETVSGKGVSVTQRSDGKYTFTMPGEDVRIIAAFATISQDNPFSDVTESDYYYKAVLWAVKNGVTSGTGDTTFSPNVTVSRAQMVTFLWRAYGSPQVGGSNPFTDVSESDYYYHAVLWAVQKGITAGTGADTFSPNASVTRAQAVTFQWRAAGSPVVAGGSFGDVAEDAYFADAVAWAVDGGITAGTGGNSFSPEAPVSRAQAVTFLYQELG